MAFLPPLAAAILLFVIYSIFRFTKIPKERIGFYTINAFAHLQVILHILMMNKSLIHWDDSIDPVFYFASWAVIILVPLSLVLSFKAKNLGSIAYF